MAIPAIGIAARALAGSGGAMSAQALGQGFGMASVGKLQQAFDAATHPMATMAGVINKVAAAAFAAEAPFKALESAFRHVGSYVGKLSPIRMEFFERAVADFQAAVGKILVPVITMGTQAFRKLGDMIATVMPVFGPQVEKVAKAVGDLITQLVDLYLAFMKTIGSGVVSSFVSILTTVVDLFGQMAKAFQAIIENNPVSLFRRGMRGESLFVQPGERVTASAKGLAFQQTATESVSGMIGRIQQNAFGYSGSPAKQTAKNTGSLLEYFQKQFPRDITNAMKEALSTGVGRTAQDAAGRVFRGIYGEQAGGMAERGVRSAANDPLNFIRQMIVPNAPIV